MDSDGSGQVRLTGDSENYLHPRFTSDGSKIVFYSHSYDDNDEIYLINTDGSGQVNLSDRAGNDSHPQLSPDGSRIVFTSDRDGNREIYSMNADGSDQQRLTVNERLDHAPSFSPDGSQILFYSIDASWRYDVHLMKANGTEQDNLTFEFEYGHLPVQIETELYSTYFYAPRFSPDGSKIVFCSYSYNDQNVDIYMMNRDGSGPQRLTDIPGNNFYPRFSHAGDLIFFLTHRWGNFDIFTMNPDGSDQQPIYNSQTGHAVYSHLSGDGEKIVFVDDNVLAGRHKVFIMDTDGTHVKRLTDGEYEDYFPRFHPFHVQ
jgi:Tol biopolymer transport system component